MKTTLFLQLFVFITGAAVLAVEMTALKQVIPYFGGSILVWALVIGTAMISLSAGYFWGGKLADVISEKIGWMFGLALAAALLIGGIFYFHKLASPAVSLITDDPAFNSPLFFIIIFALPIVLLGTISPLAVRIRNKQVETTGESAGSIYAFSTAGSIFGVYASSFFLLPAFGSRVTLLIISLALILVCAVGWLLYIKRDWNSAAFFAACVLLTFVFYNNSFTLEPGVIFEQESFYGAIKINEHSDGGMYLDINSSGRWSVYHPDNILTSMYFDYFLPLYYLFPDAHEKNMVIIGHAGGVISRQYSHFFEGRNMHMDGIELDPLVTRAAREFFHIDEHENLTITNDDARNFLSRTDKKYDLIVADAYTGALYLPFHLATVEYFEVIQQRLAPQGVFAQHVLGGSTQEKVPSCVASTLLEVFEYVYYIDISIIHSYILLASNEPLAGRLSDLEDKIEYEKIEHIQTAVARNFTPAEKTDCILTDDKAPTELLRERDNLWREVSRK